VKKRFWPLLFLAVLYGCMSTRGSKNSLEEAGETGNALSLQNAIEH